MHDRTTEEAAEVRSRSLRRQVRILQALVAVALSVAVVLGIRMLLLLESPTFSSASDRDSSVTAPYRVELVLYDQPAVSSGDIDDVVLPMVLLLSQKWPQHPRVVHIAIYREGLPLRLRGNDQLGGLIPAAYIADEGYFIVDWKLLQTAQPKGSTKQMWLAMVMGHEATHLWQAARGEVFRSDHTRSLERYKNDPHEIEAYQAGMDVAATLCGFDFRFSPLPGVPLISQRFRDTTLPVQGRDYDIHTGADWTVRGKALRAWRAVWH